MKILNIHAGTNDKDIIRFLEKKSFPKLKNYKKKISKKKMSHKKMNIKKI